MRERHRERAREICVWARYLVWPEVERGQVQGASVGGLPVHGHHVAIVIAQGVPDSGPQRERETVKTGVNQSASFPLSSHRRDASWSRHRWWCVLPRRPLTHSLTHSQKPTFRASPYLQRHRATLNSPQFNSLKWRASLAGPTLNSLAIHEPR